MVKSSVKADVVRYCPHCRGTMSEHEPTCPTLAKLPQYAADGHTEAMAVIYRRALTLSVGVEDLRPAFKRQLQEIMTTCRLYLPPSRVEMMEAEQKRALQGGRSNSG